MEQESVDRNLPSGSGLKILDLFILVFSLYVLLALIADTFFHLPTEVSRMLQMIDNGICVFFLGEFVFRFSKAPNKLSFMKWGWIDLVSSIPSLDFTRLGRAVRLIRIFRILRAFRSTRHLLEFVFKSKTQGAFTTASLAALLLVLFSSVAILQVETDPTSNIKNAEDALWWSYTTITTVGYGDRYPVTSEGRIIAAILMTAGVGLFGTFTGFVSSWFLSRKEN